MKSQVRHNTTSPEWNEDFRFLVHVPGQQYLNGELKDWDRLSASDEIGRYKCHAMESLGPQSAFCCCSLVQALCPLL